MRRALLVLLWLDGFLVGIASVAFLQLTIGTVQMPISAVVAAAANCGGRRVRHSRSGRSAAADRPASTVSGGG
ncbi:hypothetical protein CSW57_24160, partial [Williamsia muralis]